MHTSSFLKLVVWILIVSAISCITIVKIRDSEQIDVEIDDYKKGDVKLNVDSVNLENDSLINNPTNETGQETEGS